jgi:putative phage-type endonuclease
MGPRTPGQAAAITVRDAEEAAVEAAVRLCHRAEADAEADVDADAEADVGADAEADVGAMVTAVSDVARAFMGRPVPRDRVRLVLAQMRSARRRVRELLLAPGIEQRTPDWYEAREKMVTGSELNDLIVNQAAYIKKKRESASKWDALSKRAAIRWGVKYEPVACALYAARTSATVHDFGLLRHPAIRGFGASPDGITDWGVMLEIKCPFSRVIRPGEVPPAYYTQIQAQLDTTALRACDFLEITFEEYGDEGEFEADAHEGDARLTAAGMEKGCLSEGEGGGGHMIASLVGDARVVTEWARAEREAGRVVVLWRVNVYSCQRVTREEGFIERHLDKIASAVETLSSGKPPPAAADDDHDDSPLDAFPFLQQDDAPAARLPPPPAASSARAATPFPFLSADGVV